VPEVDGGPSSGADPLAVSSTLRVIVSGTPEATPEAVPKLLVISLRTMPLSVSTFTPFEPSPGYGPAVSSGISVPAAAAVLASVVGVAALLLDAVVPVLAPSELQAASAAASCRPPRRPPHHGSGAATKE
jgi:hypothetical protein